MKKDEDEKGRLIDGGNVGGGGEYEEMWKGGDGRGDIRGEEGNDMRRRAEERRRSRGIRQCNRGRWRRKKGGWRMVKWRGGRKRWRDEGKRRDMRQ